MRIAVRSTTPWACLIAARHVDAVGVTCPSRVILAALWLTHGVYT